MQFNQMQVTAEEKRNLIVIEKTIYKENEYEYRSAKLKKIYIYINIIITIRKYTRYN
jgi:hypothetical protein